MPTMYCALCRRPVEARRQFGAGSVALAVVTAGLSLLALPFYRRRCSICKSAAVSLVPPDALPDAGGARAVSRTTELEQRLRLVQGELEAANVELERLRTEQDFYRQLLGEPTTAKRIRRADE